MAKVHALSSQPLTSGWAFRQTNETAEDTWLAVKSVPTNVHLDLIEHGKYVMAFLESHIGVIVVAVADTLQNPRSLPRF